ncbi:hypothetical protein CL614_02945 [archaeon]|jgi:hypothetical protein|nr:hypothetical protein [archaeon]|tara:strand:- start:833 stop:1099 length:267 start_codon:yes stop_codon:yes gene_type:complete
MDNKDNAGKEFLSFLDSLHSTYFSGMLFSGSPVASSREEALMDVDVNKFLNKKYDINIVDKDDEYVSSFMERIIERMTDDNMKNIHFD